jgi:hypothetical protein
MAHVQAAPKNVQHNCLALLYMLWIIFASSQKNTLSSMGISFLGHLTSRFLPGFGFLNMRSALTKRRFRSISSPTSLACWSTFVAAWRHEGHI